MRYAFFLLTTAAAALLLASCSGAEDELPQDAEQAMASATATQSPTVKGQLWRWLNVTVVIPEGSGLFPEQGYWSDDRPVLMIGPVDDFGEGVTIDAQTDKHTDGGVG